MGATNNKHTFIIESHQHVRVRYLLLYPCKPAGIHLPTWIVCCLKTGGRLHAFRVKVRVTVKARL